MFKNKQLPYLIILSILAGVAISCQSNSEKRPSPLTKDSINVNGTIVQIEYSSPGVKKRKIWGELVPYDEMWRTGANKATYLTTNRAIKIAGRSVPKGSYSIFTIPTDSSWTIIFNKEWDQWGAYNYDSSKDLFRLQIVPEPSEFNERMRFTLSADSLTFDWEKLSYSLPITFED